MLVPSSNFMMDIAIRAIEICRISDACRVRNWNEFEIGIKKHFDSTCTRILQNCTLFEEEQVASHLRTHLEKFSYII